MTYFWKTQFAQLAMAPTFELGNAPIIMSDTCYSAEINIVFIKNGYVYSQLGTPACVTFKGDKQRIFTYYDHPSRTITYHRDDGPAVSSYDHAGILYKSYYQNGSYFRKNGPHRINYAGKPRVVLSEEYIHSEVKASHRDYGPAVTRYFCDGSKEYEHYKINGKFDWRASGIEYFENDPDPKIFGLYGLIKKEYHIGSNNISTATYIHKNPEKVISLEISYFDTGIIKEKIFSTSTSDHYYTIQYNSDGLPFGEAYFMDKKLHSFTYPNSSTLKPSKIIYDDNKIITISYYSFGKLHNEGSYAYLKYYPNGQIEYIKHYSHNKLNSPLLDNDTKPAVIKYYENGNIDYEEYWFEGNFHRNDNKPAIIKYYEDGRLESEAYYLMSVLLQPPTLYP